MAASSSSSQSVGGAATPACSSRALLTNSARAEAISGSAYAVPSTSAFARNDSWKSLNVSAETTSSAG